MTKSSSPLSPKEQAALDALEKQLEDNSRIVRAELTKSLRSRPREAPLHEPGVRVFPRPPNPWDSVDFEHCTPAQCREAFWPHGAPDNVSDIVWETNLGRGATDMVIQAYEAMARADPEGLEWIGTAAMPLAEQAWAESRVHPGVAWAAFGAALRAGFADYQSAHQQTPAEPTADTERRVIDFTGCYVEDVAPGFYDTRPELAQIRDAAHNRGRAADAVLAAVLARVGANTNHNVQLPAVVGAPSNLSLQVALVGPPGSGKSTAITIGCQILPANPKVLAPECDRVALGSGEGAIELLFGFRPDPNAGPGSNKKIHVQVHHNAFVVLGEGEILNVLASRGSGSILLPTLRESFTMGVLGQANASQDRKRVVAPGQAVYGVLVAFQPEHTGPLFERVGDGTPQRFLWVATTTPTPPPDDRPDWPGPLLLPGFSPTDTTAHEQPVDGYTRLVMGLPATVRDEIRANDWHRQQHGAPVLDEHSDLMRSKLAGMLAVMQGRLDQDEQDWDLAGVLIESSRRVRTRLLEYHQTKERQKEQASTERAARRAVVVSERTQSAKVVGVAETLAKRVAKKPGVTKRNLQRSLSKVQREWFEDAFEHALDEGWIVLKTEPTDGDPRQGVVPGPRSPR